MNTYQDYFGQFGGRYAAEVLRTPLDELETAYRDAIADPAFRAEFDRVAATYTGRPTPLMHAANLSEACGGAQIHVKLEGLANTGAHKINHVVGQCLLARRMGKKRVIAETGAGQHGLATAAMCAKLGLPCQVYMGAVDMRRQKPNVFWMELFGAEVTQVDSGSRTLKDAVNEALRDWAGSFADRLGARPVALSGDGARVPDGGGARGGRPVPRRGLRTGRLDRLRGRRLQLAGHVCPVSGGGAAGADRRGGGRPRPGAGPARLAHERPRRAGDRARLQVAVPDHRRRPDRGDPLGVGRGSTTPAWARSSPNSGAPGGCISRPPPTPRRWMRCAGSPAARAS